MTTEATPAAATPAPAATPPAAAVTPPATQVTGDEPWLRERLERAATAERTRILADLGVDDAAKAKKAIADAKKAEDDQKTAADHAAEAKAEASRANREADKLRKIASDHAGRMMMALKPEHQAAIKELAGDDPAKQLEAIGVLGPTWAKTGAVEALPGSSVVAPPANTAPPANAAPPAAGAGSPPDHKQVYTTTRAANPFEAAAYGLANPVAVYDIKD